MICNLMIAALVGFLVPGGPESHELRPGRGFQHLHHHFADVCGFFIFLGLAKMFLPYLLQ